MTQLIDVEAIVKEYERGAGTFDKPALVVNSINFEAILHQANTLHTQKVEEAVREDRERVLKWIENNKWDSDEPSVQDDVVTASELTEALTPNTKICIYNNK